MFAFLLLTTLFATLAAGLLFAALGLLVFIVVAVRVAALLAWLAAVALVIVAVIIIAAAVLVVFLDDLKIVLEGQGDELVLELGAHVVVIVHLLTNILLLVLTVFILIFLGLLLLGLTLGELFLVRHNNGLEEVEETLLLDSLGDGLSWLALLCLLLLLDLLLGNILAVFPFDLSALALLNDVLLSHYEALLQLGVLEVVVLLKSEDEIEAVASGVKVTGDLLKMHENRSVFLLNQASDATVVEHGTHPEPWNTEGSVLDVLDIAGVDLNFLVVFVVEELGAGLVLSEEVSGGLLLSREDVGSLLINLLVQAVILELQLTVELLILIIDLALLVLLYVRKLGTPSNKVERSIEFGSFFKLKSSKNIELKYCLLT